MVIAAHDQISAQTQPQPHDPLRPGRGTSRALEIRRRHLFTRPRRHRTGPFVWSRFPADTTAGASDATPTDDHDIRDGEAPLELASTWSIPGLLARYWCALQE